MNAGRGWGEGMIGRWPSLVYALIQVESGGRRFAVGEGGEAFGILQIREDIIRDVNKAYGSDYRLSDAWDPGLSIEICRRYLDHWGSLDRLGREATPEDLARIWNGGPNGWQDLQTAYYWERVRLFFDCHQHGRRSAGLSGQSPGGSNPAT